MMNILVQSLGNDHLKLRCVWGGGNFFCNKMPRQILWKEN
jgi:hypothetical protein